MKYLKSFKIFESSSEDLTNIIKDIFLTLDDLEVYYHVEDLKKIGLIHILIEGTSDDKILEVDSCVSHLFNYLKDLGYNYFFSRTNKSETHISINNGFNEEIEKDFLKIIDGIRKVEYSSTYYRWVDPNGRILFDHDIKNEIIYYNHNRIHTYFSNKYGMDSLIIDEVFRYMIGKHLNSNSTTLITTRWFR